jgi:C1A family cysteine protease
MAPKTLSGLPSTFSLKPYAPAVKSQGSLGSCTSWSSAYCAMTIVKGVEIGLKIEAFDPIDHHNRLKVMSNKDVCSDGNYITKAAELLKYKGAKIFDDNSVCGYVSANKSYEKKLYDWNYLSISSYNFKYALSQENSPIVIACDYYKDGWENNLLNAVWTGYYNPSSIDGAHAMVIIGYDDYKSGGAFLVQNSSGTRFGEEGYFWIKYSDINKVIYEAIQFRPNPKKIIYNNDSKTSQVFRFNNECALTAYVTLAQNYGEDWVTEGWYSIQPGSSIDLDISNRAINSVYWMGVLNNNGSYIYWKDDSNGTSFCYDLLNAHKISDNPFSDDYSCPNNDKFYRDQPNSRNTILVRNLTCPNIKTRGGEEIKISETNVSEILIGEEANKNWDGKTDLMDPFSGNSILPIKSDSESTEFDIYYLKEKEIIHFVGTKTDLIKLPFLKFNSNEYAEAYLREQNAEN